MLPMRWNQPTVEKHRGERGKPGLLIAQHADGVRAHRNGGARRQQAEELARDEAQLAHRAREQRLGAHSLHQHPHRDVSPMRISVTKGVARVGLSSR